MTYTFQNRLEHLGHRMSETNSEELSYSRGVNSCLWPASVCRVTDDDPTFINVPIEIVRKLVKITGNATELVLGGSATLPVQGDLLVRPNGDRYQVVAPTSVPNVFRYTTVSKTRIELYAQKVPRAGVVEL